MAKAPTKSKKNNDIVVIEGKEYSISLLPEEAQTQITNIRATDIEIGRLQQQILIMQTARMAYANALKNALPVE